MPTDYVPKAGGTFTGNLTLDGTANVAPNQTAVSGSSILNRDLSDARYARVIGAALASGVNSDVNTTTYKTVTELSFSLEVGTYYLDAFLIHSGNASFATSGVKDRLNFTGTATTIGALLRTLDNSATATTAPSGVASSNPINESAPTNRSQTTLRKGTIIVTVAGTLSVQIAQTAAVVGANTTLAAGSSVMLTKIA